MPVPSYDVIMYPMLELAKDRQEKNINDLIEPLADLLRLSEEDRSERMPNNNKNRTTFAYRAAWAKTYLTKACLIKITGRSRFIITDRGIAVLEDPTVTSLDRAYLLRYPEFAVFVNQNRSEQTEQISNEHSGQAPEETLQNAFKTIQNTLASDLLDTLKECSPTYFEKIVIDVLIKMGYGGSDSAAGLAVGRSGDGGIDGIIKEDALGLDNIYIQAKRWDKGTVGRPQIQQFSGALDDKGATKGVFITTSEYTAEAKEYASRINNKRIILINGLQLAEYMIKYNVGVYIQEVYELKGIDSDYFNEI
ncbi:MAG: restriction endonuclease [Deferribacterales bacterium]